MGKNYYTAYDKYFAYIDLQWVYEFLLLLFRLSIYLKTKCLYLSHNPRLLVFWKFFLLIFFSNSTVTGTETYTIWDKTAIKWKLKFLSNQFYKLYLNLQEFSLHFCTISSSITIFFPHSLRNLCSDNTTVSISMICISWDRTVIK